MLLEKVSGHWRKSQLTERHQLPSETSTYLQQQMMAMMIPIRAAADTHAIRAIKTSSKR